jgi:hypothetical protein
MTLCLKLFSLANIKHSICNYVSGNGEALVLLTVHSDKILMSDVLFFTKLTKNQLS